MFVPEMTPVALVGKPGLFEDVNEKAVMALAELGAGGSSSGIPLPEPPPPLQLSRLKDKSRNTKTIPNRFVQVSEIIIASITCYTFTDLVGMPLSGESPFLL